MSYIVADTSSSRGWRPGTGYIRLGLGDVLPNWKTMARAAESDQQIQRRQIALLQRGTLQRMANDDAYARGYRTQPTRRRRRLGSLGALDLGSMMVPGAQYVFHFSYSTFGGVVNASLISFLQSNGAAIAARIGQASGNFPNPVATSESGGMQVRFTYGGGQNYSVGSAGNEMQNIINGSFSSLFGKLLFASAEGGPGPAPNLPDTGLVLYGTDANGNPVYIDSEGNVSDAQGNVLTDLSSINHTGAITTPPAGAGGAGGSSSFNLGNFLSGLGIGGAAMLALGLVFVLRD